MGLSTQDSLAKYGTAAYTGWGETEAMYDARAKGINAPSGGSFNNVYSGFSNEIDKYVGELKKFAKDDYDFAAKWIESQYKEALGTDDAQRTQFLKNVANELERQVGRIAYDYQTGKYRAEQDKTMALTRLAEDEKVARQNLTTQTAMEREAQGASLNSRGLLAGTRENAEGLAGRDIGLLESNIQNRFDALNRSVTRQTDDVNQGFTRGLEDLTTGARRAGDDSIQQRSYGLETAQRAMEQRNLQAEQERKRQKDYLAALSGSLG
jgi:hypothetical protein